MPVLELLSRSETETGFSGRLSDGFWLQVDFASPTLVRIAILPEQGLEVDRTWMIAPAGETPASGRDRLCLEGFCSPKLVRGSGWTGSDRLRVAVDQRPFQLNFEQKTDGHWNQSFRDRQLGAYRFMPGRGELTHYQNRCPLERHYGLGDKTGPMDRTRRRFRCLQTDALGYDAELSDPLYKHAPFFLVDHPQNGVTGLLYDTLAEIDFDFGCEHSNYFEPFRHVAVRENCLIYWVIAGPQHRDVVPRLMALTGGQAMPPRAALGFGFSAMGHTDSENAQNTILEFAKECLAQKVPISAIHLGSGYSLHGKHRHVFEWNQGRFPNRLEFFKEMKNLGYHLCANIKPVLLENHPSYQQGKEHGWFVRTVSGDPVIERFWDGWGSQLDFTNPCTRQWWMGKVQSELLEPGIDGIWNDNNEAELWDETATLDGDDNKLPAIKVRPVHALLMTRSSYEAAVSTNPDVRPHMITRAGPIGISRYGETWTGDNDTSWHSLKWNLQQGLSMSLSGFPVTGHDIGGFSGPVPEPELLVRWFQMMALHPRAVMNSWKPDTEFGCNSPFMYPQVLPLIRETLALRYRFLPHLYQLVWRCHKFGHPIIAPPFYWFDDEACKERQNSFLLGKDVLVAPVVEPGASSLEVYLPETAEGWVDLATGEVIDGEKIHSVEVSLDSLPIFIRRGVILVLASGWKPNQPHEPTALEVLLFPGSGSGKSELNFFWDDGTSNISDEQDCLSQMVLEWNEDEVAFAGENRTGLPISVNCVGLENRKLEISISE